MEQPRQICVNCTVWNWNKFADYDHASEQEGVNCTVWNWNGLIVIVLSFAHTVLIVPFGIEMWDDVTSLPSPFVLIVPLV